MPPLNPFLAAFFRSPLPSQCTPTAHHILLVPATDVLLTSRDTEGGASISETIGSEEFLGSHVLRIPSAKSANAGGKDVHNLREIRGKAKPYNTVNGRSVVIKDNLVYSNKGRTALVETVVPHLVSARAPANCGFARIQEPRTCEPPAGRNMVLRHTRTPIMADLLYLPPTCGILGGGQSCAGPTAAAQCPGPYRFRERVVGREGTGKWAVLATEEGHRELP